MTNVDVYWRPLNAADTMAILNRKRLSMSAAFAVAISYTIWNGSWAAFPLALSEFWQARWAHAEDKYFAERKTTRTEHALKTIDTCNFLADHGAFDKDVAQELKDFVRTTRPSA